MSSVVRTPNPPAGEALRWQVRHDDGASSGPVDTETLKRWAAEGRLTATCRLSRDGHTWVQASLLPDLEMDWLVLVSSEAVMGPFAFAALEVLRSSGDIPQDAQVFRRQSAPAAGSQGLQLVQRTMTAEALRRDAEAQAQRLQAHLDAKDLEFEAERQQLAAEASRLRAELLRRDADIHSLREAAAQLSTSLEERQALEARIVDGERETARLRDERDAARREAANADGTLRTRLDAATQHASALVSLHEQRSRRMADLATSLRDLSELAAPAAPTDLPPAAPETAPEADPEPVSPADSKPPRPDFRRRATAEPEPAAEPTPTAEVVVEVLPPERPRPGAAPRSGPGGVRTKHLADLEAQAQQELARLKASKPDAAPFWNRRKT